MWFKQKGASWEGWSQAHRAARMECTQAGVQGCCHSVVVLFPLIILCNFQKWCANMLPLLLIPITFTVEVFTEKWTTSIILGVLPGKLDSSFGLVPSSSLTSFHVQEEKYPTYPLATCWYFLKQMVLASVFSEFVSVPSKMGLLSLCPYNKEQISKLLDIQKHPRMSCKKLGFSNGQMVDIPFNTAAFKGWFTQWALQPWQPSNTMYFPSFCQLVITKSCSRLLRRLHMRNSLHKREQRREGSFAWETFNSWTYTPEKPLARELVLWRLLRDLLP